MLIILCCLYKLIQTQEYIFSRAKPSKLATLKENRLLELFSDLYNLACLFINRKRWQSNSLELICLLMLVLTALQFHRLITQNKDMSWNRMLSAEQAVSLQTHVLMVKISASFTIILLYYLYQIQTPYVHFQLSKTGLCSGTHSIQSVLPMCVIRQAVLQSE